MVNFGFDGCYLGIVDWKCDDVGIDGKEMYCGNGGVIVVFCEVDGNFLLVGFGFVVVEGCVVDV